MHETLNYNDSVNNRNAGACKHNRDPLCVCVYGDYYKVFPSGKDTGSLHIS